MTEPRPHGSARPGGRTARTRTAVLAAAREELRTQDYATLTVDLLAQRSGVHAATIRRRWRTVEGVITDLLGEYGTSAIPIPDTGDLRGDLHAMAGNIAGFHAAPGNRRLVEGIVAAAAKEPGAEQVLRETFGGRLRQVSVLLERAVARGQVPPDTDTVEVIAALSAPFYYRLLISRRPLDAELVRTSAESAYLAATRGVFRRRATDAPDGTPPDSTPSDVPPSDEAPPDGATPGDTTSG
ncbi:TetR/AcrR family transcriptional regulator [Streptomyces diacarni]|uniref:TetR/AcrR family transcriptional regulator n=1 Tax=Streptomyces diacarni TaxID=2800381 RepID=A0A367FCN9_9ACTN|nr:TetR-like C-terminal domain-containing protein [Streptomyces diacarni]RCG28104.1 TetR/AcrR family transcriptional regulator [Streptomyces diacarni]